MLDTTALPIDHHHQFIIGAASIPFHGDPCLPLDHPYQQFLINTTNSALLEGSEERSTVPWSTDELLALHSLGSGFHISLRPDFAWEQVSRKLEEFGFKRSAEDCRRKFAEEESKTKFTEVLDEWYPNVDQDQQNLAKKNLSDQEKASGTAKIEGAQRTTTAKLSNKRKRKEDKFETLRGFIEKTVNKMMDQQEEMCKKLIDDIARRDEEKIGREEAWKKEEMERAAIAIEIRAKEQKTVGIRQSAMIKFLNNFTVTECLAAKNPTPIPSQISPKSTNPNPIPPRISSSSTNPNPISPQNRPNSPNPNPIPL